MAKAGTVLHPVCSLSTIILTLDRVATFDASTNFKEELVDLANHVIKCD